MRQLVFTEYEWNEKFRDVAAAAFDPIAEEFSDRSADKRGKCYAALDADLPSLFKAADALAANCAKRWGIAVVDDEQQKAHLMLEERG